MKTVAIIGLGLIGGSLALALKASQSYRVYGYARPKTLKKALDSGAIDWGSDQLEPVVASADIIVLATPVGLFQSLFKALRKIENSQWIITDVGSTKASVASDFKQVFGELSPNFIPAHPIAGKELQGFDAASSSLFYNAQVVLCTHENQSDMAKKCVATLWEICGSNVCEYGIEAHDNIFAQVSHLPHLLAYSLVNHMIQSDYAEDSFNMAAGGFEDFSRIASSSPEMWHDIALANRGAILENLEAYQAQLEQLKGLIKTENSEKLMAFMRNAKTRRDDWIKTKGR